MQCHFHPILLIVKLKNCRIEYVEQGKIRIRDILSTGNRSFTVSSDYFVKMKEKILHPCLRELLRHPVAFFLLVMVARLVVHWMEGLMVWKC